MERLLTRREAAEHLGFAPQTLARYAWLGKGPAVVKVGRSVRYRKADLEEWVKSVSPTTTATTQTPTPEEPAPKAVGNLVSMGPVVVIDGVSYIEEKDVLRAMRGLGVTLMLWSPVDGEVES